MTTHEPVHLHLDSPRGLFAQWYGVLIGPLVFGFDLLVSYSLVPHACSTGHEYVLHVMTVACFLVAAALQPDLFSQIVARDGISSFGFLLQAPATFEQAPELFCLDLYKEFDLDRLAAIAAPTQVHVDHPRDH